MTSFNAQSGNGTYSIQFETDSYESFLAVQNVCRMMVDNNEVTNVELAHFNFGSDASYFLTRLRSSASCRSGIVTVAQYYNLLGKKPLPKHYNYGWLKDNLLDRYCIYRCQPSIEAGSSVEYIVDPGKPILIESK